MNINDAFAEVIERFGLVEERECKWHGHFESQGVIRLRTQTGRIVAKAIFIWNRRPATLNLWGSARAGSKRWAALESLVQQVNQAALDGELAEVAQPY